MPRKKKEQIETSIKTKKPSKPKVVTKNKTHFKERCDICGTSTQYYKTFFDSNNKAHIVCDDCISIIKGL